MKEIAWIGLMMVLTSCSPLVLETIGAELIKDIVIIESNREKLDEAIKKGHGTESLPAAEGNHDSGKGAEQP